MCPTIISYSLPSLLNNLFMTQTLVIDGLRTSAPTYPTEELVMIYVGVNDHKLKSLSHFPEMEYRAKNVK